MSRFVFRPTWLPSIVTALLLSLLLSLGFWQLDRARAKQAMHDRWQQRMDGPYAGAGVLAEEPEALRYTGVELTGRYLTERQFLLDNRTHHGVAGYHVVTPLRLAGDERVVLVNRGWVAVGPDRRVLPDVAVDPASRRLRGRLTVAVADAFLLGEAGYQGSGWPRVVQRLDPLAAAAALELDVARPVLRLDADQPDGFIREWPVHWGITPQRHRGYAVQWFGLAAALVTIYLVVNLRRAGPHHRKSSP